MPGSTESTQEPVAIAPVQPAVAFIDGRAVPARLTVPQIQVMFPGGVAGLMTATSKEFAFPSEDGTLNLVPNQHYTIFNGVSAPTTPNQASAGGNVTFRNVPAGTNTNTQRSFATNFSTPMPKHPALEEDICEFDEVPGAPQSPTGSVNKLRQRGKLILDRVHDHIMLPPLLFDIIDTMEFQRLRSLKQLGTTVYLYPGATHTRFEHSIGVAHLAGLMIKKIARRQPELFVTEADVLCVQVAGLCHDLGHGPFSHLFEDIVNRIRSEGGHTKEWHHENMSVILLRRILSRVDLAAYGLGQEDANMIELLITGLKPGARWPSNVGRSSAKRFMVDIVANKRNGIDVDKLDYFLRDSLCLFARPTVDCHVPRLLASCRAITFEGESQICYEEKLALSLGDIFTLRAKLHKYAYQHRVVKVIDHMISDILLLADPHFTVRGSGGQPMKISECVEDIDGFCSLGDWILNAMEASTSPGMEAAQAIIRRLNERNLYSVAGYAQFARHQHYVTTESIKTDLMNFVPDELRDAMQKALIVQFIKITYGSSDSSGNPDDPINHVSFYNPKTRPDHAYHLPNTRLSPLFSPMEFGEKSILFIIRDDSVLEAAVKAVEKWKQNQTRHLMVAVPVYNFSPSRPITNVKKRDRASSLAAATVAAAAAAVANGGGRSQTTATTTSSDDGPVPPGGVRDSRV